MESNWHCSEEYVCEVLNQTTAKWEEHFGNIEPGLNHWRVRFKGGRVHAIYAEDTRGYGVYHVAIYDDLVAFEQHAQNFFLSLEEDTEDYYRLSAGLV